MTLRPPRESNITRDDGFVKGEDQTLTFTIYDSTGAIQSITGWTISLKMAYTEGGSSVLSKTCAITDGSGGLCTATVAAADTSSLNAGNWYYTVTRTDSGSVAELVRGRIALLARIT